MEHTKHIFRALAIPILGVIAFIFVRQVAIPRSFGEHGPYRFDNVAEQMAKEPVHGARGACFACHQKERAAHAAGKHAAVSCEACHAPLAVHARGAQKIGPMPVNRSPTLCGYCHQRLEARPKEFPQVDFREHGQGQECIGCHVAHDPEM